jgi:hypothetical protein
VKLHALKGGAYGALAGGKLTTVGWGVNFGIRESYLCLYGVDNASREIRSARVPSFGQAAL